MELVKVVDSSSIGHRVCLGFLQIHQDNLIGFSVQVELAWQEVCDLSRVTPFLWHWRVTEYVAKVVADRNEGTSRADSLEMVERGPLDKKRSGSSNCQIARDIH